jgi:hypothetical protein
MSKSTLTRRALVASTAALPAAAALSLPAVAQAAAAPDPIFAAIEAHRKAEAEFGERVGRKCALEKVVPADQRKSNGDHGVQTIVGTDDPRWIAAVREEDEGSDLAQEAALAFMSTEPTTVAGVYALLAYFADVEVIDGGAAWPTSLDDDDDDDDAAVTRHGGASTAYFVARGACRALAKIAQV